MQASGCIFLSILLRIAGKDDTVIRLLPRPLFLHLGFYQIIAVLYQAEKLRIGNITTNDNRVPMLLVHVVSCGEGFIYLPQKIGFDGIAFEIDTEIAVSLIDKGKGFLIAAMPNTSPNLVKGIILKSARIGKAVVYQLFSVHGDSSSRNAVSKAAFCSAVRLVLPFNRPPAMRIFLAVWRSLSRASILLSE